jgi:thymidine kinase
VFYFTYHANNTCSHIQPFGQTLQLVPISERVKKLTAICAYCRKEAHFTKRTTDEQELEVIGDSDKYVSTCRKCHKVKPTKVKDVVYV